MSKAQAQHTPGPYQMTNDGPTYAPFRVVGPGIEKKLSISSIARRLSEELNTAYAEGQKSANADLLAVSEKLVAAYDEARAQCQGTELLAEARRIIAKAKGGAA